tara:strand:+ start:1762 stop:3627 length:1866 start_codon:yes stop_codon:yes gene_type:complete
MSILQKLTEGIVSRNVQKEGQAILNKWEKTGLLEGLGDERNKQSMSLLLENQAKELLREASSMAAGDVEGFAAVAFPIVRRVFGGLIANDLVSVQPMSLPSGLIFFLDFTYSDETTARLGIDAGDSLYGGGVVASQLTGGVTDIKESGGGFYNLANAYASPTGSLTLTLDASGEDTFLEIDAAANAFATVQAMGTAFNGSQATVSSLTEQQKAAINYDPDVLAGTSTDEIVELICKVQKSDADKMNFHQMGAFDLIQADGGALPESADVVRRLTHVGTKGSNGVTLSNYDTAAAYVAITFYLKGAALTAAGQDAENLTLKFPLKDAFTTGAGLGSVVGTDNWGLEEAGVSPGETSGQASDNAKNQIPEIDIKVDSVAVTAVTKKLKAKWSPELGQDLNAYHNLDAEVELTGILSEQIALEIDREILNDLVQGAKAGTYFWSRRPGRFVDRGTGGDISTYSNESLLGADFTGTVSEWYETLLETINDVSAQIHRKVLRGGANFIVVGPETANLLEFTTGFRASVTHDADKGTAGAVKVGSLSKKWDVYVDPYFPRNVVLVGRNGGSFLESGYVYAPYVPLQVTPTIFGTEDFVPRKGVMTRYAKKMVRPDMYGLVVIKDFLG